MIICSNISLDEKTSRTNLNSTFIRDIAVWNCWQEASDVVELILLYSMNNSITECIPQNVRDTSQSTVCRLHAVWIEGQSIQQRLVLLNWSVACDSAFLWHTCSWQSPWLQLWLPCHLSPSILYHPFRFVLFSLRSAIPRQNEDSFLRGLKHSSADIRCSLARLTKASGPRGIKRQRPANPYIKITSITNCNTSYNFC